MKKGGGVCSVFPSIGRCELRGRPLDAGAALAGLIADENP